MSKVSQQLATRRKKAPHVRPNQQTGPPEVPGKTLYFKGPNKNTSGVALSYLLEQAPRIFADLDKARDDVVEIDVT